MLLPALIMQICRPTSELSLGCRYEVNQAWKASVLDDPDHIRELTQQAFNLLSFEWLQVAPPFDSCCMMCTKGDVCWTLPASHSGSVLVAWTPSPAHSASRCSNHGPMAVLRRPA